MSKKQFHFDDEETVVSQPSQSAITNNDRFTFVEEKTEEKPKKKTSKVKEKKKSNPKKGKLKLKKWQIIIIAILAAIVLFIGVMWWIASSDGPVYGDRCEGLIAIKQENIDKTVETMKKKYSSIESMNMEINCHQIKLDITFKKNMSYDSAKTITRETVLTLDKNCGEKGYKKSDYSVLFNKSNNVRQYEVDAYLKSEDSDDFPVYGTKMATSDKFSYTKASIKDKDTYNEVTKEKK